MTKSMLSRAVEMNDYDDTALVARSRCNHVLGKNEEAINDGGTGRGCCTLIPSPQHVPA